MEKIQEVMLDKDLLMEKVKVFDLRRTIPVPELSEFLDVPKEECNLIVRGASLEDHIRAGDIGKGHGQIFGKALEMLKEGGTVIPVEIEKQMASLLSEKVAFDITIFQRCVEEPEFELQEVIKLSTVIPEVINKIAGVALGITDLEKGNGN